MQELIVCKYGGSSITLPEDVERIKRITHDDPRRRVIAISAPKEVTNMLLELAKTKDSSLIDKIMERYQQVYPNSDLKHVSQTINNRLDNPSKLKKNAFIDSIAAIGEEGNAKELAEQLGAKYIDQSELFVVTNDFSNAKILPESENMIRNKLLNKKGLFVIPGYFGYTKDHKIATFRRGGTDLTGAYTAAALDAVVYENFTDKDGVFSADPDIVENPTKINELTYKEMRDLSYSGFKILYPESLKPVAKKRIPIHVRNTFEYPLEGTYIVNERIADPEKPVVGVAYKKGFCSFDIEQMGLNDRDGVLADILNIFKENKISVEFPPSAIDDISIILKQEQLKELEHTKDMNIISHLKEQIYSLLGEDASIDFQDNIGCIAIAGKGLKGRKGISAGIQVLLAEADVNIKFMTHGAKERCIIYGINNQDSGKAVNAIYEMYLKEK